VTTGFELSKLFTKIQVTTNWRTAALQSTFCLTPIAGSQICGGAPEEYGKQLLAMPYEEALHCLVGETGFEPG
jgi:hypothetical protein